MFTIKILIHNFQKVISTITFFVNYFLYLCMDKKLKVRRITEVSSIFVQKEASGESKPNKNQFRVTDIEPSKKDFTLIECSEDFNLFIPLEF